MKRFACILLSALLLFSLAACSKTSVPKGATATLTFIYGDKNITQELTAEESEVLRDIFDGNTLSADGIPACVFSKYISISFGGKIFAVACDHCTTVLGCSNGLYFNITEAERTYVESLFEALGGYFPCI